MFSTSSVYSCLSFVYFRFLRLMCLTCIFNICLSSSYKSCFTIDILFSLSNFSLSLFYRYRALSICLSRIYCVLSCLSVSLSFLSFSLSLLDVSLRLSLLSFLCFYIFSRFVNCRFRTFNGSFSIAYLCLSLSNVCWCCFNSVLLSLSKIVFSDSNILNRVLICIEILSSL